MEPYFFSSLSHCQYRPSPVEFCFSGNSFIWVKMPVKWTNLQRSKWKCNAPLVTGKSFWVMLGRKEGWKSLYPIGFILLRKIKLQIQMLDTALSLKADAIKCFAPEVTFANSWNSLFSAPKYTRFLFFMTRHRGNGRIWLWSAALSMLFSDHETNSREWEWFLCDCDLQQCLPPEPGLWPHNRIKRSL